MAAADPRPEELAPGVYCLQTGRGPTEANVYLVRSGPTWVLIDAARPHRGHLIRGRRVAVRDGHASRRDLADAHPPRSLRLGARAGPDMGPAGPCAPPRAALASGRYLPQYGNPLDRWLIDPLLRLLPRRMVEASLSRTSLGGTAGVRRRCRRSGPAGLAGHPHTRSHARSRRVLPQ